LFDIHSIKQSGKDVEMDMKGFRKSWKSILGVLCAPSILVWTRCVVVRADADELSHCRHCRCLFTD